jgi:hypothetical protein
MGDCDIPGHEAFYGIGIRIGFYLQYLVFIWAGASLLFKHNLPERAGASLALWLFKIWNSSGVARRYYCYQKPESC